MCALLFPRLAQYIVLPQIRFMVCFRPFAALCQYHYTPSWPLAFRLTKISRKSEFFHHFSPKLAPKKMVTAHFSPDYYVALFLSARSIIFYQKRRDAILLYIIQELDDHILPHQRTIQLFSTKRDAIRFYRKRRERILFYFIQGLLHYFYVFWHNLILPKQTRYISAEKDARQSYFNSLRQ